MGVEACLRMGALEIFPGTVPLQAERPPGKLSEREARVSSRQRSGGAHGRKKILSPREDASLSYSASALPHITLIGPSMLPERNWTVTGFRDALSSSGVPYSMIFPSWSMAIR